MKSDIFIEKMIDKPDPGGGGGNISEEVKNLETILSNKIEKKIGELNEKLSEITKGRDAAGSDNDKQTEKAAEDTKTLTNGGNENGKTEQTGDDKEDS